MKVLIIADTDPRKKVIGGISTYSRKLTEYLVKKHEVIFYGKEQEGEVMQDFKNFSFVPITQAGRNNTVFLMHLFKKTFRMELDEDIIIHAQRPDWLVPFLKYPNPKILTLPAMHSRSVHMKKGKIMGLAYDYLEKKAIMGADAVISVSEALADNMRVLYDREFISVPNGIDLKNFKGLSKKKARKKYGFDDEKIVVYVGRFAKEKNLPLLIKSCSNAGLTLFMVGKGKEKTRLEKLAEEVDAHVVFNEPVPNDEIPNVLACGDVFALTSYYEGFPTVVLEALAAGIPVVSTDVGDVHKVVVDDKTGYLANEDNIVDRLQRSIENAKKMRRACRRMAKKYSWNKIGKQVVEVYDETRRQKGSW